MKANHESIDKFREVISNGQMADALRDLAEAFDQGEVYFRMTDTSIRREADEFPTATLTVEMIINPKRDS